MTDAHPPSFRRYEEFTIMRTHAEEGFRMLAMSNRRLLRLAGEVAWTHPDPDLVDHPFANWNKVETVRLLLPD